MFNDEFSGMQGNPAPKGVLAAVFLVSDDWTPRVFKLNPNLMFASCFKFNFDQTKTMAVSYLPSANRRVMHCCNLRANLIGCIGINDHHSVARFVFGQPVFQTTRVRRQVIGDNRLVLFLNSPLPKLFC